MKRRTFLFAAGAVALSGGHALAQQEVRVGSLTLVRPWTRATPGGARVGGGYLTIRNTGADPDRLLSGTMETAGRIEIHEMATVEGIMRMRNLPQGLTIPPGGTVELRPGGFHVMFLDLARPLQQGETLDGTLTFERAGTVRVRWEVGAIGAGPAGQHRH
jgi:periplasmic copper chaperone A